MTSESAARPGERREKKRASRHSGYPGGLKSVNYAELLETHPPRPGGKAVVGLAGSSSGATGKSTSMVKMAGRQAVEGLTARATGPHGGADLVLMDLRMPVLDGVRR